jgi:hypothetical protein
MHGRPCSLVSSTHMNHYHGWWNWRHVSFLSQYFIFSHHKLKIVLSIIRNKSCTVLLPGQLDHPTSMHVPHFHQRVRQWSTLITQQMPSYNKAQVNVNGVYSNRTQCTLAVTKFWYNETFEWEFSFCYISAPLYTAETSGKLLVARLTFFVARLTSCG